MPRTMIPDGVRFADRACTYYSHRPSRFEDGDPRCRIDLNWPDPQFHTHCLGCGASIEATISASATNEDPQVVLDRARAAFLDLQSKITEVRRVYGRPQSARATLSRTNEALAACESLLSSVVASG